MKTRIQKWGNSLAVRIPKSFAGELDWEEGAPVEMALDESVLVIRSDSERFWDLAALLDKVTDDNIHPAWETENL
jgi:antitoxin MazE